MSSRLEHSFGCDPRWRVGLTPSPHRRAGLVLALLGAAIGCQSPPADAPSAVGDGEGPVRVAVVYPERAAIHREVSEPGTIEAFEETPVFAKVSGYVKDGWKDRGAMLRKGEILAELSAPELVDDLGQKETLVGHAEAMIEQAREAVAVAEKAYRTAVDQVEVAEANRQIFLAREERTRGQYLRLERTGTAALDRENIDEAKLAYTTARAGTLKATAEIKAAEAMRDENKARWDKALADLKVAEVNRKVAQKNRDVARDMVAYLRLEAPYDCVVFQRNVVTGDFVQAATAGKGQPLFVVHRTDRMRISVQVPEIDAPWVREGDRQGTGASIRIQALPGEKFAGRVARISWSLDPIERTLRAEVDVPNPDGLLRPGMYAYATLTDEETALTLPRSAVVTEGEITSGYRSYCWQVEDGKVRRLAVELGPEDRKRVAVLRKQSRTTGRWEPFTGDEEIVRGDVSGLKEDQAVQVEPEGR
jgi:HlyD family secretion protein